MSSGIAARPYLVFNREAAMFGLYLSYSSRAAPIDTSDNIIDKYS